MSTTTVVIVRDQTQVQKTAVGRDASQHAREPSMPESDVIGSGRNHDEPHHQWKVRYTR